MGPWAVAVDSVVVKELSYRLLSYMIDQIDDFEFILFGWGDTR